jgi:hypothetical protein
VSGAALAWVVGLALAVMLTGVAVLLLGLAMPPEDKR